MRRLAIVLIVVLLGSASLMSCTDEDYDEILKILEAFTGDNQSTIELQEILDAEKAEDLKGQALQSTDAAEQERLLAEAIELRPNDPELRALRQALRLGNLTLVRDLSDHTAINDACRVCGDDPRMCVEEGDCARQVREAEIDAFRSAMESFPSGSPERERVRTGYCDRVATYSETFADDHLADAYLFGVALEGNCPAGSSEADSSPPEGG